MTSVGSRHAVSLYEAAFLVGSGCRDDRLEPITDDICHQFLVTGDRDALTVTMRAEDEWRGTEIWEALPDGYLLQIVGVATGRVNAGRIEARGNGALWYGTGLPASTSYGCTVDDLRLTFTPVPR